MFTGFRFGEDLAIHLAAADVMVFPSRTDTFGLVNLEAMACGVPVAAYPVTGPIDVIEDGVTGALDVDLGAAARRALALDPGPAGKHALRFGWDSSSARIRGQPRVLAGRQSAASSRRLDAGSGVRAAAGEPPPGAQPKLILASRLVRESASPAPPRARSGLRARGCTASCRSSACRARCRCGSLP
jgi:hypothetical protein